MSQKSIKISQLLVLSSILFLIFSLDYCDGFKLRDLAENAKKGDENKVTRKKNVFKDAPMKKVTKIVKIEDDNDDDDETNDEIDEDNENDHEKKSNYIFEKVHKQSFDIPKRDIEAAMQKDEEEDAEIEENSINFFGLFGGTESEAGNNKINIKTTDDKNKESLGFFNYFTNIRKTEDEIDTKINEESKGWMYFFNRMPFNLVYNFIKTSNEEGEKATEVSDDYKDNKTIKFKHSKEPMNVDTFDRLLLEIPSFTPNYSKIHNIDCRRQGQIFQRQLRGQRHWALQSE